MAKLGWFVLIKQSSLWASVLVNKYACRTRWLDGEIVSGSSPMRKGIVRCGQVLRRGLCFRVGNGESIDAWKDPWVPWCKNFKPKPRDSMVEVPLKVQDLILRSVECDLPKVRDCFLDGCAKNILKTFAPISSKG